VKKTSKSRKNFEIEKKEATTAKETEDEENSDDESGNELKTSLDSKMLKIRKKSVQFNLLEEKMQGIFLTINDAFMPQYNEFDNIKFENAELNEKIKLRDNKINELHIQIENIKKENNAVHDNTLKTQLLQLFNENKNLKMQNIQLQEELMNQKYKN